MAALDDRVYVEDLPGGRWTNEWYEHQEPSPQERATAVREQWLHGLVVAWSMANGHTR